MGTSGITTFAHRGLCHRFYCSDDGGPAGLGLRAMQELKSKKPEEIIALIDAAKRVDFVEDEATPPTVEDMTRLRALTDLHVGKRSTRSWFCLTYKAQGSFLALLTRGYCPKGEPVGQPPYYFPHFEYIVDFDEGRFHMERTSFYKDAQQRSYSRALSHLDPMTADEVVSEMLAACRDAIQNEIAEGEVAAAAGKNTAANSSAPAV